jgi:hypothetical protein
MPDVRERAAEGFYVERYRGGPYMLGRLTAIRDRERVAVLLDSEVPDLGLNLDEGVGSELVNVIRVERGYASETGLSEIYVGSPRSYSGLFRRQRRSVADRREGRIVIRALIERKIGSARASGMAEAGYVGALSGAVRGRAEPGGPSRTCAEGQHRSNVFRFAGESSARQWP